MYPFRSLFLSILFTNIVQCEEVFAQCIGNKSHKFGVERLLFVDFIYCSVGHVYLCGEPSHISSLSRHLLLYCMPYVDFCCDVFCSFVLHGNIKKRDYSPVHVILQVSPNTLTPHKHE